MRKIALISAAFSAFSGFSGFISKAQDTMKKTTELTNQKSEANGQFFSARIINWNYGPEVSGGSASEINNACTIEITTPTGGVPESIAILDVFPFMKVHGHGAPDRQIITAIEGNKILISKIAFTMSGRWELHLRLNVDGKTDELELPVLVP